jgi:cytochrome c-type biogenesis protein CcmH/NrfF
MDIGHKQKYLSAYLGNMKYKSMIQSLKQNQQGIANKLQHYIRKTFQVGMTDRSIIRRIPEGRGTY